MFLGANHISWSSNKQQIVTRQSTKAEYKSIAIVASEIQWVKSLLTELGVLVSTTPTLYFDNPSVTYLCANLVFHSRMKHLTIDYHFVHDLVQSSDLRLVHVSFANQLEDDQAKSLPRPHLLHLCVRIGVSDGPP